VIFKGQNYYCVNYKREKVVSFLKIVSFEIQYFTKYFGLGVEFLGFYNPLIVKGFLIDYQTLIVHILLRVC